MHPLALLHLQSFFTPDPLHALIIRAPANNLQHLRNASIPKTAMAVRQNHGFPCEAGPLRPFPCVSDSAERNAKRQAQHPPPGAPTAHDAGTHSFTQHHFRSALATLPSPWEFVCQTSNRQPNPYDLVRGLFRVWDRLLDAQTAAGLQKSEIPPLSPFRQKFCSIRKIPQLFHRFLGESSAK